MRAGEEVVAYNLALLIFFPVVCLLLVGVGFSCRVYLAVSLLLSVGCELSSGVC